MKKMLCVLLLAGAGCYVPAYTVRKPLASDPPLSREEVERLSSAGVSEPVIVELLDKRGAATLTPDDVIALKNAGAPDTVVQKAISSERKVVEKVIVEDYYAYPYPYYYGYPYYGVSYGFAWGYGGYYHGCYPHGGMGVRVYR